ncbi:M23 family metallopeptidase [Candidatus Gracilibacteria bacterium]|nr:M23 family metallopeptidase [Candidatus Gracilibacteria bacterium]
MLQNNSLNDNTESEEVLKVNKSAKLRRHKKVFLNAGSLLSAVSRLNIFSSSKSVKVSSTQQDPIKKFTKQTVAIASALLIFTSFQPATLLETGFTADYFTDTDYIGDIDPGDLPSMVMTDDGVMMKSSVEGGDAQAAVAYSDSIQHTVTSGQTLSAIAAMYSVKQQTIMWENGITNPEKLRVGQVVTIPPVDGVSHVIASKTETLASLAKTYGVEVKAIKDHNKLLTDTITQGQRLFIPGGKQQVQDVPVIVRADVRGGRVIPVSGSSKAQISVSNDKYEGTAGGKFVFPTNGKVTQGFKKAHLAIDIGNPAKPDIVAAADGKIIKKVSGCPQLKVSRQRKCGGGFGNYYIIDHGNGYQTLYAHLDAQYKNVGDVVASGDAIGQMGSSGNVYGMTGIHLHIELYVKGMKQNFMNYLAKK